MYVYDQVLHSTFVSKNYQVQFDNSYIVKQQQLIINDNKIQIAL